MAGFMGGMAGGAAVNILIKAIDNYSKEFKKFNSGTDTLSKNAKKTQTSFLGLNKATLNLAKGFAAVGVAVGAMAVAFGVSAVKASMKLEKAMMGLTTVANAFGVNADEATKAAISLSQDGLMSVAESSEGLKNLLGAGLNLSQAIKLMEGFKDSAAFNRQGTLAFGEAIVGATQGIKNQNSILVDNAGITKNLSMILKEAGYTMQDMSDSTKGAAATAAMYNGLLKEMSIFEGDAAKSSQTLEGQLSMLRTEMFMLKAEVGDKLSPKISELVELLLQNREMIAEVANAIGTVLIWALELLFKGLHKIDILAATLAARWNQLINSFMVMKEVLSGDMGFKEAAWQLSKLNEIAGNFIDKVASGEWQKEQRELANTMNDLGSATGGATQGLAIQETVLDMNTNAKITNAAATEALATATNHLTQAQYKDLLVTAKATKYMGMGEGGMGVGGNSVGTVAPGARLSPNAAASESARWAEQEKLSRLSSYTGVASSPASQKLRDLYRVSTESQLQDQIKQYGGTSGYSYTPNQFKTPGHTDKGYVKPTENNVNINLNVTGNINTDLDAISEEIATNINRHIATG